MRIAVDKQCYLAAYLYSLQFSGLYVAQRGQRSCARQCSRALQPARVRVIHKMLR